MTRQQGNATVDGHADGRIYFQPAYCFCIILDSTIALGDGCDT